MKVEKQAADMKAGVLHCRCAKCFSVPARKRVRKRVTTQTLLSLPEEVILCVLQCLSAEDLLAVRAVHPRLRDLVDGHASVWAKVSFQDQWPSPDSLWLFERAAEKGNFEAAVKLGIAYLYNEGPSLSDEGRADVCGRKASRYFSLAESLRPLTADPFVWVFIRPPWSPSGSCCKAVVYERLRAESDANKEKRGALLHSLARVLQLFDDEEKREQALQMLEMSACSGSVQSAYLLWEHRRRLAMTDPGRYLQSMRLLRDYAAKGCWEAQLSLAKLCISGNPLGMELQACTNVVAQLFSPGHAPWRRAEDMLRQGLNDAMRYILVDWLVEVTTMKDFSSLTLHVTVYCVDRYLVLRSVPKARLQLLGIACMVICTRYVSKEILTIREAVWLTDNTYQYEDLVRMMGEVIAVLGGRIRTPTLVDYGGVLQSLLPMEGRSINLLSYISELSLLYTCLSATAPAHLACAALLLTRAIHHYAPVWPPLLVENTGFSSHELVPTAMMLYIKCFRQDVPKDHRDVSLTGVKQRFEDDVYQQISKEPVMELSELCHILEVPEVQVKKGAPGPSAEPADMHTFLSSPSSHSKRRRGESVQQQRSSLLATPTAELSTQEEALLGDILDWSLDTSSSGYEGDQESEGEKDAAAAAVAEGPVLPLLQLEADVDPSSRVHCRALSSDDDSSTEEDASAKSSRVDTTTTTTHNITTTSSISLSRCGHHELSLSDIRPLSTTSALPSSSSLLTPPADGHSSGYSSVQNCSPTSSSSSPLLPCTLSPLATSSSSSPPNRSPGFRLLVPAHGPVRRQVKRKNGAAHSGEEGSAEGGGGGGGGVVLSGSAHM
ncbi:cyclin-F isoform X2 [Engraulis encrasicolus]|uniref:cyclin-F isoform X2 n=1 Tax=Engraulis encrasicolus TaxID=184585 RepID=UPI002FCFFF1A